MGGGGRSGAFPIHSVKPKLVMRLCGSSNRFQRRHYWSTFLIRQGFNSDKYLAEGEKSNRRDSLCDFFSPLFLNVVLPFPPLSLVSLLPLKTHRNQAPQAKPIAIFHPGERITSITKSLWMHATPSIIIQLMAVKSASFVWSFVIFVLPHLVFLCFCIAQKY